MSLSNFENNLNIAVIGASGGIGRAFAERLAEEHQVDRLLAFSRRFSNFSSSKIETHHIDITEEESIKSAASIASMTGALDIVIIATGLLHDTENIQPEKSMQDLNSALLSKVLLVNTIGPALVAKHFIPLLNRNRRTVFAILSAKVGSISDNRLGGWYAYRASKAAVNMIVKNLAIETARSNPLSLIIGLHPGTVDTKLSKPFQDKVKNSQLFAADYSCERLLSVINVLTKSDTGLLWSWDGKPISF